MYTARFSVQIALLDVLDPDQYSAGVVDSGYNSLRDYPRVAIVLLVGDMASGATLDMDIEQATDTSGSGAKAISGKSITQLTDTDDNKRIVVELRTEELDVDGGYCCINAEVTVGTAEVDFALAILGLEGRYLPVSATPWEEVVD